MRLNLFQIDGFLTNLRHKLWNLIIPQIVPDYREVFFAENNLKLHIALNHDHFMNNYTYDKTNFSSLSPKSLFLAPSKLNFKPLKKSRE